MYIPEVQKDFVWSVIGSPWGWTLLWILVINFVTFFVFGLDKLKAKRKVKHERVRRIPERTLFLLAAIGGSIGALLGMHVWHHKTLHKTFQIGIPLILLLQIVIPAGFWLHWNVIR